MCIRDSDYTVNDYFLPVTAGDIFTNSKDEWFVLIGQDCDMARSITRTPKNALAELLPAKVRPQTDFEKWTNDLRSASIYSFRKNLDAGCEVLQVEYQKREYIANEILNLCSFNSTGECKISLSDSIGQEMCIRDRTGQGLVFLTSRVARSLCSVSSASKRPCQKFEFSSCSA